MRVISGTARGRCLISPKGDATRPTADRIKESLFNIINADLEGASFLDLFAGSGAIGIEALSRGARKCVFVDSGRQAHAAITKNLENVKLTHLAEVYLLSAEESIETLGNKQERFDIVFMDPPYGEAEEMERLTGLISKADILAPGGYIIGEHGANMDISAFCGIERLRRKNYGKTTAVTFWRPARLNGEGQ